MLVSKNKRELTLSSTMATSSEAAFIMQIFEKALNEIKPYKNNPRKNDEAVPLVAASIKEFGFKVPIVIDSKGVIVCGHTRYAAAASLGLMSVPRVVADDLSPRQIKAFRLADNKVSERAEWDAAKLSIEFDELEGFDMEPFGFDFGEEEEDEQPKENGYYGDERERTADEYNLRQFDEARAEGFYQIPMLRPTSYIPSDLIGFNYVLSTDRRDAGVHFFIDDYQFRRCYERPDYYIEKLSTFPCVLTPDWSLYMDMPIAMQIYNVYRSHLFGQMCQDAGIEVIPTLQWAGRESYQFCFDGTPRNSVVAVSTVGVMRSSEGAQIWRDGMAEAIKRLHPKTIVQYGVEMPDFDYQGITVKHIKARGFKGD